MKRRTFLFGLSSAALLPLPYLRAQINGGAVGNPAAPGGIDNPYDGVDWDGCLFMDSMSHLHMETPDEDIQKYIDMGYGHLALSNYYPSAPTYPLPAALVAKNPGILGCPNAEHHSFIDNGGHANGLGSLTASGYGSTLNREQLAASPLTARFENLNVFKDDNYPGRGVYRLDISAKNASPAATEGAKLTIEGAVECEFGPGFKAKGEIRDRAVAAGDGQRIYMRATAPTITATLTYDKAQLTVTQFRMMQGTNRPWREAFRALLDGETIDGHRQPGLLFADGGGITLNHPTQSTKVYTEMLDFDPRVLGIEVWNVLATGFGSDKGILYDKGPGPHWHFYKMWDEILTSGRRCLGFFVKDHIPFGRGRNVLVLPNLAGLPVAEREHAALRAYRKGCFFGSVGALASDDEKVVLPYDRTNFRFSRIVVRRDAAGKPEALEVSVTGNDTAKRPNLQIRFVTENGVERTVDAAQAEFPLANGAARKFVRVEAFSYPNHQNGGEALTKEAFGAMNVYDISQLYEKKATARPTFFGNEQQLPARIPIVDMIFSQPIRFLG